MFHVVNIQTNDFLIDETGDRLVFYNGDAAATVAADYTQRTGAKHVPRRVPVTTDVWHARETDRFLSGVYKRPDFYDEFGLRPIAGHFVHLANDPTKIAYTQNDDKGAADIQTPIRVGSYLTQYYPDLSGDRVRAIAVWHENQHKPRVLLFANTPDEIETVYSRMNGPRSCMSARADCFQSFMHPVRVYGDSDLSVAYFTADNGDVAARCLVWRDRMIHGRPFGDHVRIVSLLESAGYRHGYFNGAKIRYVECENHGVPVLPYIDETQGVERRVFDGVPWFVICDHGDYQATNTHGLAEQVNDATCERCGDGCDSEETFAVLTGRGNYETWCDCCTNRRSFYCDRVGESVARDAAVNVDGELVAEWYARDNANRCDHTGDFTWSDLESVEVLYKTARGASFITTEQWSPDAIESDAFECRISKQYYSDDLAVTDEWHDDPRAVCVAPDDVPHNFKGSYQYRSYSEKQFDFNIHVNAA